MTLELETQDDQHLSKAENDAECTLASVRFRKAMGGWGAINGRLQHVWRWRLNCCDNLECEVLICDMCNCQRTVNVGFVLMSVFMLHHVAPYCTIFASFK